jgi:glutaredoxin
MPSLALYHFDLCPYCRRVRKAIDTLGLDVTLRNIHQDPASRDELREATGRTTVPCLRIEDEAGSVTWMHESSDIVEHLQTLAE